MRKHRANLRRAEARMNQAAILVREAADLISQTDWGKDSERDRLRVITLLAVAIPAILESRAFCLSRLHEAYLHKVGVDLRYLERVSKRIST